MSLWRFIIVSLVLCVIKYLTLCTVPSGFQTRQGLLEAAHRLYYEFWGNTLDHHLRPVPDSGGFMYLTQEKINYLQLRDQFFYLEDTLLVRNEYEVAYQDLVLTHDNPRSRGVVVLGQSGIGVHLTSLWFRSLTIAI